MIPSYVSVFVVEYFYTSFWTGFWNLYGLIVTGVGLSLDGYGFWWLVGLFTPTVIILLALFAILFLIEADESDVRKRAEGWLVRHLGASWVATSLNWGLYFGFTAGAVWGFAALVIHGFLMFILVALAAAAQ